MKKKIRDWIEQEYFDMIRAAEKEKERDAAMRKYWAAVDKALSERLDNLIKHGYYKGI